MTQDWLMIILLTILTGIGKAMRDTISFQWDRSIFDKIEDEKWWWWFKSDPDRRLHHPIWFLWDGWHFGDTLSYVGLLLAMMFVATWWQVVFCAALFGGIFQLFYRILFVVHA